MYTFNAVLSRRGTAKRKTYADGKNIKMITTLTSSRPISPGTWTVPCAKPVPLAWRNSCRATGW